MNYSVCQACLKQGDDVFPITTEDTECYNRLIEKVSNDTEMYMCIFCTSLLRKLRRFIKQCLKAQTFLSKVLHQELQISSLQLKSSHNLIITPITTSYIAPKSPQERDVNLKLEHVTVLDGNKDYTTVDEDGVPLVLFSGSNGDLDGVFLDTDVKKEIPDDIPKSNHNLTISPIKTSYIGPEHIGDVAVDLKPNEVSIFDTNEAYITEDEDDVPLVLFSGANGDTADVDVKNVIHDDDIKKEDNANNQLVIKQYGEELNVKKERRKPKKQKKTPREGFSSRMVQETDEYIVIKLTKEQVLDEMRERLGSDKYLRAPYKCEKCAKGFNFEDVLQSHMELHSMKNGPLQCELCSQYCPSPVSLRGHMKSHTTRYKCKLCGYVRLSRQNVLEHYSIVHSNSAAGYSCEKCDFTTNKRTVMQRHARAHGRAEPHACHTCGKLYRSVQSLRVHALRHDSDRRFRCEECSRSFVYPAMLHRHVQSVHLGTDYYCVECDLKFKSMDTLRLHFKRAKSHRDSSTVKRAARGAAEHSCEVCARAYGSRAAVRAHVRRRHTP